MAVVEIAHVTATQCLHGLRQTGRIGGQQQQVHMVVEQHVGMHSHIEADRRVTEQRPSFRDLVEGTIAL